MNFVSILKEPSNFNRRKPRTSSQIILRRSGKMKIYLLLYWFCCFTNTKMTMFIGCFNILDILNWFWFILTQTCFNFQQNFGFIQCSPETQWIMLNYSEVQNTIYNLKASGNLGK